MENNNKKTKPKRQEKNLEKLTPEMVAMGLRKWLTDDKNKPKRRK